MGLKRQVLDRAQGLDTFEKRAGILPAEPSFPPAIDHRFVQDLHTDPRPLPQDVFRPIRLWAVVKKVKDYICIREFSAHAQRRGSGVRPWIAFRETVLALAGLHRREVGA